MAKLSFTKLGIKKLEDSIVHYEYNGCDIEIKTYLPVEEKLALIGRAINESADNNRFFNLMKFEVHMFLEIIEAYTNLTFTDKQKEDKAKLYDMLNSTGLLGGITASIPEFSFLMERGIAIAKSIYEQMNSIYGIMENVATDYKDVGVETEQIQKALADPNNLTFLKDVMTKLG